MSVEAPAITRLDPADDGTMLALFDVYRAVWLADDPAEAPPSVTEFRIRRALAPPLAPPTECWYVPGGAGTVAGLHWLKMPDMENLDRADLTLMVHPAARRQGLGRALLRHAASRARADGRTILETHVIQGGGGQEFARQAGAAFGLTEIRRVLDLGTVPALHFAQCRAAAARAAGGYSLVRWTGRTPDEHLKGVAAMFTAMNDAPNRPDAEPDVWDERRVRERLDHRNELVGFRTYQVAARCDATGEMVALTEVRMDRDEPEWASQGNTVVARPHRGHRLGLLIKAAMLEWLADQEPALTRISTYNAAVNRHMIAINEELGFEASGPPYLDTEFRVADVLEAMGA